ncbi:hypothetical protein CupriaWKF_30440 [Cupriavidus sp. WKF15]|nr:haloacid dehalogenase-like hydrolase [Cupriavidus sp. WKF15]WER50683.1 hypothetical protein CupriaWKF_30440 [Cupriavidus sp. WKF15]
MLSYREGKVTRLHAWFATHGETLDGSYGYSDSLNDVPLLQSVEYAHVVNPDDTLREEATRRRLAELRWRHDCAQP